MTKTLTCISLFVLSITVLGCVGPKVISSDDGIVVIKGPRIAWGPGHETYTSAAHKTADQYCLDLGRDKASYIGGEVKLFDGDYNRFLCMVPTAKILTMPHIKSSIEQIGECVRFNIVELDDLSSDAKTIADGIATVCTPTIDKFLDSFLVEKQGTNAFNSEYRKYFKSEQYTKILPFVLKWRRLLKNGRQEDTLPSKKELPNSMFQI